MSTTETESNENGKRGRPVDDDCDEEPVRKQWKNSDEEDEKKLSEAVTAAAVVATADPPAAAAAAAADDDDDPPPKGDAEKPCDSTEKTDATSVGPTDEGAEPSHFDDEEVPIIIDRTGADPSGSGEKEGTSEAPANPGTPASAKPEKPEAPAAKKKEEGQQTSPASVAAPAPEAPEAAPASGAAPPAAAEAPAAAPPPAAVAAPAPPSAAGTVVDPDPLVEEQAEIPAMHVGRVIGKGGEMIRDLQARSGARLDVDQNVPVGLPRKITYRGTRSTVDFAKHLVALLCTEGVDENSLPLGKASQEKVVIPSQAVGKVIGRGGEMIRELQTRSHAKIQIDHTGASGVSEGQKQVTITGTFEAVQKGKEMVLFLSANPMMDAQQALNMLIDEKLRTRQPWGTGPPYPDLPNQGMNMQPAQLGYAPYEGGYLQQPPLSYQQPVVYGGPPSYAQRGGPPSFSPTYGVRETEIFYAAKQFMGRIIGGRGVTINDLTRRSGCDIQINQDVPPGQDCEITIKGSREGIESAKQMIQEIIEVGPQHPYAGGAGDYGGAGYQAQAGYQQVQQYPYQYQQLGYGQEVYGQAAYGRVGYVPQDSYSQQYGGGGGGYGGPSYGGGGGYQAPSVPPSDWKTATAPDGQIYYFNERTGETQWDKPAGMS